jgi:Fuc2NAc and GlcNAc transferase
VGAKTVWVPAAAFVAAALLTLTIRKAALARGLVDVPNTRSSHQVSTPRGGGLAIVLVTTLALLVQELRGALDLNLFVATLGGLAVALIGFADDHRPVRSSVRLLVHFGAAIWAAGWLGGPSLHFGGHTTQLGWLGYVLAVLGIVWVLNLFNFMDGIDGLAASEAIFVLLAGAWLTAGGSGPAGWGGLALVLAAACGGFLVWNWPPAKIFLGDVGSGYLGYLIAVLALATAQTNPAGVWVWLILGGAFFVDATVTLARRTLRGERAHEAHRSHAYQWLARRWGSHRRVTLALLVLNLAWSFPWALYAARHPEAWVAALAGALLPLAALALAAGSGRPETPPVAGS